MGAMKERMFRAETGADELSLDEIAHRLGGEVDGRFILCPSPGCDADDRSCCVRVNPDDPGSFFVYYCEGARGRAYNFVREALDIEPDHDTGERLAAARKIWGETIPAPGTVAEKYLRSRSITIPIPECIRFHPQLKHSPSGAHWPAMVTEVVGLSGGFKAIHRTYLRPDGNGKAPVEPDKMTLGPIGGGCARLSPVSAKLVIGEGIETTLSAMQLSGLPGWAALSTGGMKGLLLPSEVESVVIAADVDEKGWGEKAAKIAARRFALEGRTVAIARPDAGKDFNDVLRSGAVDG